MSSFDFFESFVHILQFPGVAFIHTVTGALSDEALEQLAQSSSYQAFWDLFNQLV